LFFFFVSILAVIGVLDIDNGSVLLQFLEIKEAYSLCLVSTEWQNAVRLYKRSGLFFPLVKVFSPFFNVFFAKRIPSVTGIKSTFYQFDQTLIDSLSTKPSCPVIFSFFRLHNWERSFTALDKQRLCNILSSFVHTSMSSRRFTSALSLTGPV
jgi:hypothetical protein